MGVSKHIDIFDVSRERLSILGMLKVIESAQQKHGDMVLLRFSLEEEILLLGSADHVRFWRRNQHLFRKAVDVLPTSSCIGRLVLGETLNTSRDGDEWARLRELSLPLTRSAQTPLRSAAYEATNWFVNELLRLSDSIDLVGLCVQWSLRTVLYPLLGDTIPEQHVLHFIEQLRDVYFKLISFSDGKSADQLRNDPSSSALRQFMDSLADASLRLWSYNESSIVNHLRMKIGSEMSPEEGRRTFRAVVFGMLAASVDNVAAAFLWTLIHLSQAPEIAVKIASEAVYDEHEDEDWAPTRTPVAYSAVKEVLRLTPVSPLIERASAEDIDLAGYQIPVGTNIMFSPWLVHRNPEYWVDPLRFNPERFLRGRRVEPDQFFPFGVGSRACVGMTLALHQITLAASIVCSKVNFSLAAACKAGNLRPSFRLMLWPRGPIHMKAISRTCS